MLGPPEFAAMTAHNGVTQREDQPNCADAVWSPFTDDR
jgi:hypothetical protein